MQKKPRLNYNEMQDNTWEEAGARQPLGTGVHAPHRLPLPLRGRPPGGTAGEGGERAPRPRGLPCEGNVGEEGSGPLPGRTRLRGPRYPYPRPDGGRADPPRGHGVPQRRRHDGRTWGHHRGHD